MTEVGLKRRKRANVLTTISLWLFWTWMVSVAETRADSCGDGETGAHASL